MRRAMKMGEGGENNGWGKLRGITSEMAVSKDLPEEAACEQRCDGSEGWSQLVSRKNIPERGHPNANPWGRDETGIFSELQGQCGRNREQRRPRPSALAQEFPAYSSSSPYHTPGSSVVWAGGGGQEGWEEESRFIHSRIQQIHIEYLRCSRCCARKRT